MTLDDLQEQLRTAVAGMDSPPSGDELQDRRRFKDYTLDALLILKAEADLAHNALDESEAARPALEALVGELGLHILGEMHDRNVSLTAGELSIIFEVPKAVLAANEEHAGKGPWRGMGVMIPLKLSETPLSDAITDAMIRTIYKDKGPRKKVRTYLHCNLGISFGGGGGVTEK